MLSEFQSLGSKDFANFMFSLLKEEVMGKKSYEEVKKAIQRSDPTRDYPTGKPM